MRHEACRSPNLPKRETDVLLIPKRNTQYAIVPCFMRYSFYVFSHVVRDIVDNPLRKKVGETRTIEGCRESRAVHSSTRMNVSWGLKAQTLE